MLWTLLTWAVAIVSALIILAELGMHLAAGSDLETALAETIDKARKPI